MTMHACSNFTLSFYSAATIECHAEITGHNKPPHDSIQAFCQSVDVLSMEVYRHTGNNNCPFFMSWLISK